MIICTGNAGSTSLKSKIIDIDEKNNSTILGEANIDQINTKGKSNFSYRVKDNPVQKELIDIFGFESGIRLLLDWYVDNNVISTPKDIQAMGFKCVMGETNGANSLTPEILDEMKRFYFVAPVHNISYVQIIEIFRNILNVPMVGVFEPSFHYSIPEFRRYSGFPWEWHSRLGIRKFGFHGSSHRYLSAAAYKLMASEKINVITIHLGGSSSMAAIKNGEVQDVSMSFSPNSGLLQGTRVGDIDGTALLFAMKELDLSIDKAQHLISNEAGIKSMAGLDTDDVKTILNAVQKGNHRAKMAIDLFVDGIRKYIGSFSTVLGGIDCMIFGGGIGENSQHIRERCLDNMDYMGIKLDLEKNKKINGRLGLISSDYSIDSKVKVFIAPTDEEIVVAYFTRKVVEEGRDLKAEDMTFRL